MILINDIKGLLNDHPEFIDLCHKLSAYAKQHNLSREIIFDGVAWDGYEQINRARNAGIREGRVIQSNITSDLMGLLR